DLRGAGHPHGPGVRGNLPPPLRCEKDPEAPRCRTRRRPAARDHVRLLLDPVHRADVRRSRRTQPRGGIREPRRSPGFRLCDRARDPVHPLRSRVPARPRNLQSAVPASPHAPDRWRLRAHRHRTPAGLRSVGAVDGTAPGADRQLHHDRLIAEPAVRGRLSGQTIARGNRMVKVAPRPEPSLAAAMVPPCASTRARLIVRPMPEPEFSRVRGLSARKKRSNRRDRSSALNPSPSSATAISTVLPWVAAETVTVPPWEVCRRALLSKFPSTWARRSGSAWIVTEWGRATSRRNATPAVSNRSSHSWSADASKSSTARGCSCTG